MPEKRAFLQWTMLLLTYVAATFFAAYYGLLQTVWRTDVTLMTSAIAAAFVGTVLYMGWASWRYDNRRPGLISKKGHIASAIADTGIGRTASYVVTLMGLLGTVIGLSLQAQAMANINFADPNNLIAFIKVVAGALGSAFFATGAGIVGSIGIIIMTANLDYFIDHDGEDQ